MNASWPQVLTGLVFLPFGVMKWTAHDSEIRSFRHYGLPWPELTVNAVGVVEVVGGLALIFGIATRLVCLALAADMLGAFVVAGLGTGEIWPSLTLAPMLLGVTVFFATAGHRSRRPPWLRSRTQNRPS